MDVATKVLNEALLRHAKGMVTAWERWLRAQTTDNREQQSQPREERSLVR